ncbi:hypothetical protein ACWFRF_20955 [Nocardia sp. NPDC055165]
MSAELDALTAEVNDALSAVAPPPLYSLAARHALEIAERIARDSGREQVELADLRRALDHPNVNPAARRGGESPSDRRQ